MTARTNTSIRLSADERRRLLAWGPDLASAVRRVLGVADAARDFVRGSRDEMTIINAVCDSRPVDAVTTRDRVRNRLFIGRSVTDIARELGVTRQAVQYHARKIREGA